ncbi:DUF2304 domain-containing protein [Candidatus Berkelbacteria bacterium]|nr:DUF2304 domain-containing protein [Candidatus Berkelbacteria bacterium]
MIASAIVGFLAALVIAKSYDEFRHGREPFVVFLFWLFTWIGVAWAAIFPASLDIVREKIFGPSTGQGTILGIGLVFLLFLSYRFYLKADRIERRVDHLISDLAIQEFSTRQKREE